MRAGLREALKRLAESRNKTIILVEHRIHEVAEFVDRVVLMEEGEITMDMDVGQAFKDLSPFNRLGLNVPQSAELFARLGLEQRPLNARDALRQLKKSHLPKVSSPLRTGKREDPQRRGKGGAGSPFKIRVRDLCFQYDPVVPLFQNLNLTIRPGERVGIMGPNGCGKTTLLLLVAGLLKPSGGGVRHGAEAMRRKHVLGRGVGFLLQNPDLMLIRETVTDELRFPFHNTPLVSRGNGQKNRKGPCGHDHHPSERGSLFCPEPGAAAAHGRGVNAHPGPGHDSPGRTHHGPGPKQHPGDDGLFRAHRKTLLFTTHDLATTLHHATRLLVMKKGRIQYDGPPRDYFIPSVFDPRCGLVPNDVTHLAWELGITTPVVTVEDFVSLWRAS